MYKVGNSPSLLVKIKLCAELVDIAYHQSIRHSERDRVNCLMPSHSLGALRATLPFKTRDQCGLLTLLRCLGYAIPNERINANRFNCMLYKWKRG